MKQFHQHLPIVFLALTFLLIAIYWVGLTASREMDYATVGFTFGDALSRTAQVSVKDLFQDRHIASQLWFVPFALIVALLYFVFSTERFRMAFLFAGVVVPFVIMNPSVILLAITLPIFLFGSPNGEDWGEAWSALSAAGSWTLLALIALVYDLVSRKRPGHSLKLAAGPQGTAGSST